MSHDLTQSERPPVATADAQDKTLEAPPSTGGSLAVRWAGLPWAARPALLYLGTRLLVWWSFLVAESFSHRSLAGEITRWDSRWFLLAAGYGWPAHMPYPAWPRTQSTVAFFPLFPLTIRGVAELTRLPLLDAGTLVSLLSGLTAMVAVWALARHLYGPAVADRATLAVAIFPGSFVLSMVYAEGMAVTFVAVGLWALLNRRWVLAGVLGALATATSPIALAFVVSAAWCAGAALRKERDWRALAAPLLSPLGTIGYLLALWAITGSPLTWTRTERNGWHSFLSLRFPFQVLERFFDWPWTASYTIDVLFAGLVVGLALVLWAARLRLSAPLFLYGLVAAAGAAVSTPVGLRPRFLFLAFPLVMGLGIGLKGRVYWAVMVFSGVLLVLLAASSVVTLEVFP